MNNIVLVMNWIDKEEADKQIDLHLRPILESWIGGKIPLNFTKVYGVRRYLVQYCSISKEHFISD